MEVLKDLAGAEDLLLDAELPDIVTQSRGGSDYSITKVNAKTIPYTGTFGHSGVVSIKDKLDNIDTSIENLEYIVDTVDDLATYTGTGLVMVKDINRGGTFISKTAIEIDPNTGSLYVANGGTVFAKLGGGFWVRQDSGAVNVKWFGAKGDSITDDTVAIQTVLNIASQTISETVTIDLQEKTYLISSPLVIKKGALVVRNGHILQSVNTKDCIQFDGSNIAGNHIFYVDFDNLSFEIVGESTPTSGVQVRNLNANLGWFTWKDAKKINKGGLYGFCNGYNTSVGINGNTGGPLWEINFENLWFNLTYSSSILIPGSGGMFSMTEYNGGVTTISLKNVHTNNVSTSDAAYRIGNGVDHLTLENISADGCTRLLYAHVKTLNANNLSMEDITPPVDIDLKYNFYSESHHDLVKMQGSYNSNISGFSVSFSNELMTTPHADGSYVHCDSIIGEVTGIFGTESTNYKSLKNNSSNLRTDLSNYSINSSNNAINSLSSRRVYNGAAKAGTFPLFPIDLTRACAYLITLRWEFADLNSIHTFIVHTGGTLGGVTGTAATLLAGQSFGTATITFVDGNVVANVASNTYVTWTATNLFDI